MANHLPNQGPSKPRFFSVSIEIEISGVGNRDRVLQWLQTAYEMSPNLDSFAHRMTFDQSTKSDLIDLDLVVEASSLKEASQFTTGLLNDIEKYVREASSIGDVGFEQMSRTLTPA
ncbi:hypothetical protein [Brevibacterium sp. FME37]|uniref:hypothetical protein n=1 Tax=Brevibacterium sp. FME37 TaxID=2742607 RepID=UPI00186817B1|nr:hypothetical protein [Brevibacterium sp. FME37]